LQISLMLSINKQMKKIIIIQIATALLLGVSPDFFAQINSKPDEEIGKAKQIPREAKKDPAADFIDFRKQARISIENNQKKIIELKSERKKESKELKKERDKMVLNLEKKNAELKSKIDKLSATQINKWSAFKLEFTRNMKDLGIAIKDLVSNHHN
jgi:hypothetical protein